ncbi:MAG: hypothetical protein A9Z00_13845 [Thermobacillus sp. ZCTH02-B1]|uniref:small acid-soluble spore protein P n=1 Tax=Thermobacillus sp. ZCTH02-B1 TaxID=1858795 RepID=UPI000B56F895|nr:small acid-soluble spore protein P [Thermobacillus sp. ZCTH02-B1]OUM95501.1 MAG: hypothetical protein A9Z00_13845 [Thermobacillus sp. ZCTH02-B1]
MDAHGCRGIRIRYPEEGGVALAKPRSQAVPRPGQDDAGRDEDPRNGSVPEPLSGSKKVKNRRHSRQNQGEGS